MTDALAGSASHDPVVPTYAAAGVDIDAGERAVELMREAVERSRTAAVVSAFGAFGAAVVSPGAGHYLVSSTDGVGTKLCLVETDQDAADVGRDLVHHSVNDILTCGARPLFFLDYLAFGRLQPTLAAAIVTGMAQACRRLGCALVGGETAELPDIYREGAFDVAGSIVGTVAAESFVDGRAIGSGDVLIGLPALGLHTNGYSLARRLLKDRMQERCGDSSVREALLREHPCYLEPVARVLDRGLIHGMAHITGGGLPGNVARVLPAGLAARVDPSTWPSLPIFDRLAQFGVAKEELYRTFNMGIGFVLLCAPHDAEMAVRLLGGEAYRIGEVIEQTSERRVIVE